MPSRALPSWWTRKGPCLLLGTPAQNPSTPHVRINCLDSGSVFFSAKGIYFQQVCFLPVHILCPSHPGEHHFWMSFFKIASKRGRERELHQWENIVKLWEKRTELAVIFNSLWDIQDSHLLQHPKRFCPYIVLGELYILMLVWIWRF